MADIVCPMCRSNGATVHVDADGTCPECGVRWVVGAHNEPIAVEHRS